MGLILERNLKKGRISAKNHKNFKYRGVRGLYNKITENLRL